MNVIETLSRAEAVIDLLRVNLAGDFCAALPSNAGQTLIEARQDSGVAACELVAHLIRDARREVVERFADDVANGRPELSREFEPVAPAPRAKKKGQKKMKPLLAVAA